MWKGLKKTLLGGRRSSKAQKTAPAADVSHRSASSAGALFQLDLAELDALAAERQQQHSAHHPQHQCEYLAGSMAPAPQPPTTTLAATPPPAQHALQQQQQQQQQQQGPAPAAARTWAQLQAQLQQQFLVQQLVQQGDDSTSKRRAAAVQKRTDNAMLNPSACLYHISALLSLTTLFEHKLQRDTFMALQQQPSALRAAVAAASSRQQQQQHQQALAAPGAGAACFGEAPDAWACRSSHDAGIGSPAADAAASHGSGGAAAADAAAGGDAALSPAARVSSGSATAASTAYIARSLAAQGYRVIVRKVLHSKAYWTKSMDNTFIVALDSSSGAHVEYIVDPHFKEVFNVGVMSDNYRAVWHALPQVFVGMPGQLQSAVQLLCDEMELSFLEAGRPCPPWRGWAATINRWMSDQFVDILVPPPGAPAHEVADFMARCTQPNASAVAAAAAAAAASSSVSAPARMAGGVGGASAAAAAPAAPAGGSPLAGVDVSGAGACGLAGGTPRLSDKVHVSSVLSSASVGRAERHVPEPLQQLRGFVGGAASPCSAVAAAAPQLDGDAGLHSSSSSNTGPADDQHPHPHPQQQQQQQRQHQQQDVLGGMAPRAHSAPGSDCSSSRSDSVDGGGGGGGGGLAPRSRSLLTAQMQFKAQLEAARQRQGLALAGGALGQQQAWPAGAPSALTLLELQQQQQQHQLALLQMQQLAAQQQSQQQQQGHRVGGGAAAQLLPVVHTVRPVGMQQQQQQHQGLPPQLLAALPQHMAGPQPQQPRALPADQQQQQQQQPGAPAGVYQYTAEQPRLLRLIHRPKAAV